MPLTNEQKIEYFGKIYKALQILCQTNPESATGAVASLRLLLIDAVGEIKQKRLIGEWNGM